MQAMEISRTGLEVEWRRLEIIAQNIANANTSRTAIGEPFRAMRLLSGPKTDFAALLAGRSDTSSLNGVGIQAILPENVAPRVAYEPENPQADENGFVSYPGVQHSAEMALMVETARAYEANLVAMNTARQMYMKAMDLGKNI